MKYANVIVDISHEKLDRTFQYIVPEELEDTLKAGTQVSIPFGNGKNRRGYVVEISDQRECPEEKLKVLNGVVKKSVTASGQLIELAWWMKERYGCTMNQALKTVIPVKKEVQRRKSRNSSVYEGQEFRREIMDASPVTLNEEQKKAAEDMLSAWKNRKKGEFAGVHLLYGVTGSGKTEVYLELLDRVLEQGWQAIVLIPEISLTYQTILRFRQRFGDRVEVINSRLSQGERYERFERAKKGEISVMIGPRSALFTPFPKLGLIILDEEHDGAYKSETMPRYHARDVAIKRGEMNHGMVVLGSATPSLESFYRAKSGLYHLHVLKHRAGDGVLYGIPKVLVVDLRQELLAGNRSILSRSLREQMDETLKKGQQIMLFLNRRGYSGFVSCRSCGSVFTCPHCSVSLKAHRNQRLKCHYCGFETSLPDRCPTCGSPYIGTFGTGTQKAEELVKKEFPEARVLRMDTDTVTGKEGHEAVMSEFRQGRADILIGTQMIVKGHDLKNVTLVGILAADLSLFESDFGAAERTFSLLTQAAGRAGRGKSPGKVIIQTYRPEHYSIRRAAAQDYEGFYEDEMAFRRMMKYPPFCQMAALLISSTKEEEADRIAGAAADGIRHLISVIGPVEANVARLKDQHRRVIYLKDENLKTVLEARDEAYRIYAAAEKTDCVIQFDLSPGGTL